MQQTFLAILTDDNGKQIDFQRFSCKRIRTAENNIRKLWKNSLYRTLTKEATKAEIYRTGYSREGLTPEITITL